MVDVSLPLILLFLFIKKTHPSPLIAFLLITVLTGASALFLVEAMASIEGNESFQASIEFSTIAELFLGNRWQWALQGLLYIALQSQTITSLIETFQVVDILFIFLNHHSSRFSSDH
jgi:hypothetical protein